MDCPFPGMVHISGVHPTGSILKHIRKYCKIKRCSNEMNFSQMQTAKTEGYLVA